MKIVGFRNGTFAVRKGWLEYKYLGHGINKNYWWPISYLREAQVSSYAAAKELLDSYIKRSEGPGFDYGTPVKEGLEIG